MMQSLSNKHCNQTGANSFWAAPPPGGGHLSLWFPSSGDEAKMGCHHTHSSSGQPNLESATFGFFETSKKERENHVRPFNGNADYASHQVQMEHPNQPLDIVSYPFAGSYFGRMYDPNTVVYPQMMGMAPTRAVLPLDCSESLFPIYVNAKQYHAILRRRQTRAKLEARNKMIKSRKPYLHESRHLHALKRVRGSGGRFLNTKNMQEEEKGKSKNPSKNNSWGDPTTSTSGSDVSCIFNNNDDIIFTQPGDRLALSIDDGYSQFSTTPA